MAAPRIPGNRPDISSSQALKAFARALSDAKDQAGLTDAAVADTLGRSLESARLYRLGDSEIALSAFLRAIAAFGETMSPVLALAGYRLVPVQAEITADLPKGIVLSNMLHELLVAVQDGELCDADLRDMADEIAQSAALLDELRDRLATVRGESR
jgi:hypothetical protein